MLKKTAKLSALKECLKRCIDMVIERGGGGMDANHFNANGIECVGLATGYGDNIPLMSI